jgi:hypothetical protein
MRVIRKVIVAALCVVGASLGVLGQTPDPIEVLAAARKALGGEENLTAVRTFVATGRTRQLRGNNLVPIEFEISCELPDRFVRKDESPAQDTDLTVTGFSGDALIQFPPRPTGRGGPPLGGRPAGAPAGSPTGGTALPGDHGAGAGGGPAPTTAPSRLALVKQDFARLMLGAFATSFPSYPLTFTYAALGEAPEGTADILDVAGPDGFSARFVIQRETHLPVLLTWQAPAPGQAPVDAKPAEYRIYYGDFRDVNRVKWPFRIRRAIGGDTVEEITFDQVRINVKIDRRKFENPK